MTKNEKPPPSPVLLSASFKNQITSFLLKDIIMTLQLKEKRVPFQLNVPESLNERFRQYVFKKHNGYKKGNFAEELERALTDLIEKGKDNV